MKFIPIILLLALLAGCAVTPVYLPLDAEDAAWLRGVWQDERLEFSLPPDQAPMAWKRGQSFIARFSGGIIYAYAFAIRSHYGGISGTTIVPGFNVSRIVTDDGSAVFNVQAYGEYNAQTKLQAKLLAHYMRTGDLRDHLVQRQVNLSELTRP